MGMMFAKPRKAQRKAEGIGALPPMGDRHAMQQPPAAPPGWMTPVKPPKRKLADILGEVGAAMMDFDGTMGTGNLAAAKARTDRRLSEMVQQMEADRRNQILLAAMGKGPGAGQPAAMPAAANGNAPGGGPQGGPMAALAQIPESQRTPRIAGPGAPMMPREQMLALAYLDPSAAAQYQFGRMETMDTRAHHSRLADATGLQGRERLSYLANPDAYGKSMATNYEAANLAPGATRVYGDGREAFHNADTVGLQKNAVTARGDQLDYDLGLREDATERYGHDVTATGHRLGYDADMAQLDHARTVAEREAAGGGKRSLSPIYGVGPDGNPMVAQLTTSGELLPAAVPEGFSPLSPFDKAQQRATGSAMGKGAAERELGLPAQARQLETFRDDFQSLRDRVGLAKSQTSKWNTGPLGQHNPLATDLQGTLDTIRANAGFDKLQEMRDNSPTGGAVGQVSNIELRGLQSAWGNIERSQSKEQLDRNLDAFVKRYEGTMQRMEAAYREDMAAGLFGPGAGGPAMAGGGAPALPPGFVME